MPDNEYLNRQLRWLIQLRWIAIIAAFLAALAAHGTGYYSFQLTPVVSVLGFVAAGNLIFTGLARFQKARAITFALLQIMLDQATLGVVLYLSGSCLSPFLYFFLFHVVISGILLPYRSTVLIAVLAAVIPAIVVGLSHYGAVPHYDIFNQSAARVVDVPAFLVHGASFLATLALTAYFVVVLNKRLLRSHRDLERSNLKLSTLVTASHTISQLSEIEGVLSRSFQSILNNHDISARIIIPSDEQQTVQCYDYLSCTSTMCPAYHTDATCWYLMGTMCARGLSETAGDPLPVHTNPDVGPARTYEDIVNACTNCAYFAKVLSNHDTSSSASHPHTLNTQKETLPLNSGGLDAHAVVMLRAMREGQRLIRFNKRSSRDRNATDADVLAFPFRLHDRLSGLLLLRSSSYLDCTDDTIAFIRLLSEVTATGLFGANLFEYLETSYLQLVMALANAVEAKDPYTRGHSERVAFYCIQIAVALGLTKQEKEHLSFAALLHDIGKIGTNIDILHKKEKLALDEQEALMSHALVGSRILDPVHFLKPILGAIRHHHENFDGSGYPSGLKGHDIPLQARIVKIADTWDAMTSDRPYRTALPKSKALAELVRFSGTQFDPELVKVFLQTSAIHDA